ncbi:proteasome subunit beta [Nakamurella aerolata]|uniref:Proteasome subunit beta n=1 Tax=Nakamurella aerolata TaxID=1656892 RepID=A0A849A7L0_9ACTN|nr:proteasome subunit beta [Nakamurella aerolata]NNG34480.1 proteasome subunit beta [Nakamurella aerolata]
MADSTAAPRNWPTQAIPAAYLTPGTGSFADFLRRAEPQLLPGNGVAVGHLAGANPSLHAAPAVDFPHGTTVVALTTADGVVMAGDRRATQGNVIAQRDIEKVFVADSHSVVGIAGAAGLAVELVRMFRLELEHYEKIEGVRLSLDGKANRLASMIRGNLGAALQGMAVVPIFAGVDLNVPEPAKSGRIYSYDVTGGRYEEHDYYGIGSGSIFAKSALKKRFRPGLAPDEAVRTAIEALYDAADDDTATGGPDLTRKIFPVIVSVNAVGATRWSDDAVGQIAEQVIAGRMENPGG